MRIVSIKIDGYGIFQDAVLDNLNPGLVVIYSPNGGGKTTLKSFLQNVLFEDTGRKQPKYHPWYGNRHQGRVTVMTKDKASYEVAADFAATRQNRYTVTRLSGAPAASLPDITSHVSHQLYTSIFAIGLDDLRDTTLKDDEVKSLIGGIPRIGGKKGLTGVLQALEKDADLLYKKSGSQPSLNVLITAWNNVNAQIKSLLAEQHSIGNLEDALEKCKRQIEELNNLLAGALERERHYKQLDKAWEYWPEFHRLAGQMDALATRASRFHPDGAEKLATLQDDITRLKGKLTEQRRQIAEVEHEKDDLQVDDGILLVDSRIRTAERTVDEFRSNELALLKHQDELEDARAKAQIAINQLPNDGTWTEERVLATNRSTTATEQRRLAGNLDRAAARLGDCEKKVEEISVSEELNSDGNEAAHDGSSALLQKIDELNALLLESAPALDPVILEKDLEPLKRDLVLFEKNQTTLEALHRQRDDCRNAIAAFLNDSGFSKTDLANFNIPAAEQAITQSTQDLQNAQSRVNDATDRLNEARHQADSDSKALEAAESAMRDTWAVEPEDDTQLDIRQSLLRRALGLLPERRAAESAVIRCEAALKDAQQEAAAVTQPPATATRNPRLTAGGIMVVAGLVLSIVFHTKVPLLAVGILVLAVGVALLVWPQQPPVTALPAAEDRKNEILKRLQNELESAKNEVAKVIEKGEALARELGCEISDSALDEAQNKLDTNRRARRNYEVSLEKIGALRERADAAAQKITNAQQKFDSAATDLQAAREIWMKLLDSWHLPNTTLQSEAVAFLRSVKMYQDQVGHLHELEDEILALSSEQAAICSKSIAPSRILNVPPPNEEALLRFIDLADQELDKLKSQAQRCEAIKQQIGAAESDLRVARSEQGNRVRTQQQLIAELDEARLDFRKAETEWRSFLGKIGFDENLDPETLEALYRQIESAAASLTDVRVQQDYVSKLCERQAKMLQQLNALLTELKLPACSTENYLETVGQLAERLQKAQDTCSRQKTLDATLASEQRVLHDLGLDLEKQMNAVSNLFAECGVEDEEAFLKGVEISREYNKVQADYNKIKSQLEGLSAPGEPYERLISELSTIQRPMLDEQVEEANERVVTLRSSLDEKRQELGRLEQQISTAEQSSEIAELLIQKESLSAQIAAQAEQWMIDKIAVNLMTNARQAYERERQPEVTKWAGSYLSIMSGNEYSGILLNMENEEYVLQDGSGKPKDVPWNRALQDQVYLALRMAIVRQHASTHEPLPVIMDDLLVNCDHDRVEGATRAVTELAREFQVFYFTCHAPTQQLLRVYDPGCDCVVLQDGRFRRQTPV